MSKGPGDKKNDQIGGATREQGEKEKGPGGWSKVHLKKEEIEKKGEGKRADEEDGENEILTNGGGRISGKGHRDKQGAIFFISLFCLQNPEAETVPAYLAYNNYNNENKKQIQLTVKLKL